MARPGLDKLAAFAFAPMCVLLALAAPAHAAVSRKIVPAADAFVTASAPARNYGRTHDLFVRRSPGSRSYLTFRPGRLRDRAIIRATLHLFARKGGRGRYSAAVARAGWSETKITWSTAPDVTRPASSGDFRRGHWVTLDVSGLVEAGSDVRLVLLSRHARPLSFASRESKRPPYLTLRTIADSTAPTVDLVSPSDGASYSVPDKVEVEAAAADSGGIRRVDFFDNGKLVQRDGKRPYDYTWSVSAAANGTHRWTAAAYDKAAHATISAPATVTVAIGADSAPPTPPTALVQTASTGTSVSLSWNASTDDTEVVGYTAYVGAATAGTTASAAYTFSGLSCGTTYVLGVEASDAAGNVSPRATLSAATAPCDASGQPSFPIRAAFYYPWYPETWTVNGSPIHYAPSLGLYSTTNASVGLNHIGALAYGGINGAISSWWGQGHYSDARLRTLLAETVSLSSPLRWAVYHEGESLGDPSSAELASDLAYIRDTLASSPAYLRVDGRFVVFVYNASPGDSTCRVADRWSQANAQIGNAAYVVLKVFPGYQLCTSQPDGWHQYAPAAATDSQGGLSYSVSPGFWRADEATPRLARSLDRWSQNVRSMIASGAPWQLVTTFNEWGEGTAVESADEWHTASGYGAYLDALHTNGTAAPDTTAPSKPTGFAKSSATQTSIATVWDASSDDVGVAGYRLRRSGSLMGSSSSTSYTFTGLACGTAYGLAVESFDAAGNTSGQATLTASTSGCSASSDDPVVAAAGDIACDPASGSFRGGAGTATDCRQRSTSDLLVGQPLAAVLTLGDNQYENGTLAAFQQSFDPSWGRVKTLIHPSVGNHEYQTSGAAGYYAYFGSAAGDSAKGYYSYDVGTWHLIALNSNCSAVGGCGVGSPQELWMKADLAAHANTCTLAYWHHPRFSSGEHGNGSATAAFWSDLYAANADLVLNGHDHDYERFAPQSPAGTADPARGIREFVVGTGGKNHYSFTTVQPGSEIRSDNTYGVLRLTLHPGSYEWEFVPESGKTFTDAGAGACH